LVANLGAPHDIFLRQGRAPGCSPFHRGLGRAVGLPGAGRRCAHAEADSANDIVVTAGYAKSLEKAAELKRKAPYALDAVNAEDIGRFPTRNASDALQLVTGVTVESSAAAGFMSACAGLGPSSRTPSSTAAPSRSTT
jgi:hypothetical protein